MSKSCTFTLENLGCANCAAKMESAIGKLPGVDSANISFPTRQLRVTGDDPDQLLPQMQRICDEIEDGVVVTQGAGSAASAPAAHNHERRRPRKISPENLRDLIAIICGALLFVVAVLLSGAFPDWALLIYLAPYAVLGWPVLWSALRGLFRGRLFDENFLMAIATVGAFFIGEYPEAVAVMLFYRAGSLFEHIAVDRSRSAIMEAVDMRPETVLLEKDGMEREIPCADAVPGDVLIVRAGDRIPLDGRILQGETRVDTSPITGEPVPVWAGPGSEVVSGCINLSGAVRMEVQKPLSESMVTRILNAVENAAAGKPKIDRFLTRFSRVYTPIVVGLAALLAVIPPLVGLGSWQDWLYRALMFLVVSCPCALVISVPMAFFSGIGRASRDGILFKGGASMEALAGVKAAVLDKTGTITYGSFSVTGVQSLGAASEDELLRLAACAESRSTHPIALSLVAAAADRGLAVAKPDDVREHAGKGLVALLPEGEVAVGNRALMDELGIAAPEADGTQVFVARGGALLGRITVEDAVKPQAAEAIRGLEDMGVHTAMLTGDAQLSAQRVADAVGISDVHARLMPDDKLTAMRTIRDAHGPVLFVGDGINDAPVLAGADVGAAMGSGADAAIEAADIVYMTSQPGAINRSIKLSRTTLNIARFNIVFALLVKVAILVTSALGLTDMWMAVFADVGVSVLCILNSLRVMRK